MTLPTTAIPPKSKKVRQFLTSASIGQRDIFWMGDEEDEREKRRAPYAIPDWSSTKSAQQLIHPSLSEALEPTINATKRHDSDEAVSRTVVALFEEARDEIFEDGMESDFSRKLIALVRRHGNAAVEAIASLIAEEGADPEVSAEALRWLGHMEHPWSYNSRRWLLEWSLLSSLPRVRDGAALGLASLDDPAAIPYLVQAIKREPYAQLREDMQQVLAQLEATRRCLSS